MGMEVEMEVGRDEDGGGEGGEAGDREGSQLPGGMNLGKFT